MNPNDAKAIDEFRDFLKGKWAEKYRKKASGEEPPKEAPAPTEEAGENVVPIRR